MAEKKIRKNTSAFNNTVKDFEIIRKYLRILLMDGSYAKADFEQEFGVSSSSFRDMFARIENYLEGGHLSTHTLPGKTGKDSKAAFHMVGNPFRSPVHYLADVFLNASFNPHDMQFYFAVMQITGPSEEDPQRLALAEYDNEADAFFDDNPDYEPAELLGFSDSLPVRYFISSLNCVMNANRGMICEASYPFSFEKIHTPATIKKYVRLLVKQGYMLNASDEMLGRDNVQEIAALKPANDLSLIDDGEERGLLYRLWQLTVFFYHTAPLCVPGFLLARNIREYLNIHYSEEKPRFEIPQANPYFQFYNNARQNIIDDDVLWRILECIDELKPLYMDLDYNDQTGKIVFLPAKVIVNAADGRHYVWGYDYGRKRFRHLRLDKLSYLHLALLPHDEWYVFDGCNLDEKTPSGVRSTLDSIYRDYTRYSWTIHDHVLEPPAEVMIHFTFPKDRYAQYKARLEREKKHGSITELGDGSHIDFSILVNDTSADGVTLPISLNPWIRSFGGYALIDEDVCPQLYRHFAASSLIPVRSSASKLFADKTDFADTMPFSDDFTHLSLFNHYNNKAWLWLRNYINAVTYCDEYLGEDVRLDAKDVSTAFTGQGTKFRNKQISDEALSAILNKSANNSAKNDENLYVLAEKDGLMTPVTSIDKNGQSALPVFISTPEKAWLSFVLKDPKSRLFLTDDEINDVAALFDEALHLPIQPDYFVTKYDAMPPGDYSEAYVEIFQTIMKAIDELRYVNLTNTPPGRDPISAKAIPVRLIHNARTDSFALATYIPAEGRPVRMNLSRLSAVTLGDRIPEDELRLRDSFENKHEDEPIILKIIDKNDAFSRAARRFSDYDTYCARSETDPTFIQMAIEYYGPEKYDIVDSILRLGEYVQVISPEHIKKEVQTQRDGMLAQYKAAASTI